MIFVAMHANRSLMLMGCLTPNILLPFLMRGQALKRKRVHLKVPGWLSDSSALLTAKFPMRLSRLKDTSGRSETIWLGLISTFLKFLTHCHPFNSRKSNGASLFY